MAKRGRKSRGKGKRTETPVEPSLTARMGPWLQENRDGLRFGVRFLLILLFFHIIFWDFIVTLEFPVAFTGRSLAFLLGLLGVECAVAGPRVLVEGFPLEIIYECTGIYSALVYLSLIMAYPTSLRNKAVGTVLGLPVLFAVNQLRLVFLSLTGIIYPPAFEFVHIYFWQVTVMVFVIIFWLVWFEKVVKDEG